MKKRSNVGQALVEYMAIFAFIGLFSINLANSFNDIMNTTIRGLAFALTQQLSIGVCEDECLFQGYQNR